MDEVKLKYFMSMCRHLNFTRAAEDLNVVQSTISKKIAALEDELNVKLFERNNRSIQLTPSGRRLAENSERFANQYRAINTSVQKLMMDFSDILKVGVGLFEAELAHKPLSSYSGAYPSVEVNCHQYSYSTLVSHCRTGVVDVGIGTELCSNACKNMSNTELFTDRWLVAAHRDSDFWRMSKESQAVLDEQIVITTFNNEYEPVRPYCIENRLAYSAFSYSNQYLSLLSLLMGNLGIALLPSHFRKNLPACIRMEDVLKNPLELRFMAIYDANSPNKSVVEFIHYCRDAFK